MTSEEVKPSFSLKYLILTLISAALVGIVGIAINKYFESRPVKIIEVFQNSQIDILNDEAFPKDQVTADYHLKEAPNKKILTLFRKVVSIKNAGNEGVEDLSVSAILEEKNAHLVTTPKINTEPKEIIDAIAITRTNGKDSNNQTWNISLLNPNESVTFEYFVYSEEKINTINLTVLPRKKDWSVTDISSSSKSKETDTVTIVQKILLIGIGLPFALILAILTLALPFYYIQWARRPDFRKQYASFQRFYFDHKPELLFKSEAELQKMKLLKHKESQRTSPNTRRRRPKSSNNSIAEPKAPESD